MVTKDRLVEAAWDFLNAVANIAKSRLGSPPTRTQRSTWVERTSPGTTVSKSHERIMIDADNILMLYAGLIHEALPAQANLGNLLVEAGIPDDETYGGFLMPLVRSWLKLPNPFTFAEANISPVIKVFTDAVLNREVVTRIKNVIVGMTLKSGPMILEEGICIRPVTGEELWGLGDEYLPTKPWLFFLMPSEEWNILDIELKHELGEYVSEPANSLREAIIAGLLLLSSSNLGIEQIIEETNYGIRVHGRWPETLQLNRGRGTYVLDNQMAQRLKSSWPRLREIVGAEEHYLRLPVARLIDGATRSRPQDAVIDYSVGLEALLTKGATGELRYRFALRGSTILNLDGSNKRDSFERLQELYGVRSSIVHGSHVDEKRLRNAQSTGEEALRRIWWWFFDQGKSTLEQSLLEVDNRILE